MDQTFAGRFPPFQQEPFDNLLRTQLIVNERGVAKYRRLLVLFDMCPEVREFVELLEQPLEVSKTGEARGSFDPSIPFGAKAQ